MDDSTFIEDYLIRYKKSLFETDVSEKMTKMKKMLLDITVLIQLLILQDLLMRYYTSL